MSDSSLQQKLDEVFSSFQGKAQELIPVLQAVQREFGYLSGETMLAISKFLNIPASRVFEVAHNLFLFSKKFCDLFWR